MCVRQCVLPLLHVYLTCRSAGLRRQRDAADVLDSGTRRTANAGTPRYPLVLVSPTMGDGFSVRVDPNSPSYRWWCHSPMWSSLKGSYDPSKNDPNCFHKTFGLKWDEDRRAGIAEPGVHVRPHGGYHGFDAMTRFFDTGDWDPVLRNVWQNSQNAGIKSVGHPYDWRLSVDQWRNLSFPQLRGDIENAVRSQKQRAVVVTSSMGSTYFHTFLQSVDPKWKDEHIEAFVPVNGPFNGAVSAVFTALAGLSPSYQMDSLNVTCPSCGPSTPNARSDESTLDWLSSKASSMRRYVQGTQMAWMDKQYQKTLRSFPSLYFVMPKVDVSRTPHEDPVIVSFPNGIPAKQCLVKSSKLVAGTTCGATTTRNGYHIMYNFLAADQCAECVWKTDGCPAAEGFDIARTLGVLSWKRYLCCKRHVCEKRSYRASELPDLFRHIGDWEQEAQMSEYALAHPTSADPGVPVHCIFGSNTRTMKQLDIDSRLRLRGLVMGDGDGTVDDSSLRVCQNWNSTVKVYKLPNVKHAGSTQLGEIGNLIGAIARGDKQYWQAWKPPSDDELKDGRPPLIWTTPADQIKRTSVSPSASLLESSTLDLTRPRSPVLPMFGLSAATMHESLLSTAV
eukprot:TRINITY_DN14246_c0_g2_i1.p1 TRINITY_DN14246_c0_g2~~TRINITY_DN14246_c0_g2_i1.p1  ORF type:complete len:617 (+),score=63.48 TRINITY_DN14246_c0_g2_i1:60-1910(+)